MSLAFPTPWIYTEAARWFRKAAEQGEPRAQYDLRLMYNTGRGVPRDDGEAVRCYRKAAEPGDALAQYNLGSLYATGQGVPRDACHRTTCSASVVQSGRRTFPGIGDRSPRDGHQGSRSRRREDDGGADCRGGTARPRMETEVSGGRRGQ